MSIVTFGESMLSYKPAPAAPDGSVALTTAASVMVQAVAGAELNVAVAATLVGESCEYVSVLPAGPMGQMVVDGAAQGGLKLKEPAVKYVANASLATLHVVDDGSGPRPHYQRSHSAFCTQLDGTTFDWPVLLRGAKWLHVTGITPPLGAGPFAAWKAALAAAGAAGVSVSFDLNHRPGLGGFDELWGMVEPELKHVTLLTLSEGDLLKLGSRAGVWPHVAPHGKPASPPSLSAEQLCEVLAALRRRWSVPMVCCTFKRPLRAEAANGADAHGGGGANGGGANGGAKRTNVLKAGGNRRFSAVAFAGKHGAAKSYACTAEMGVEHHPIQALGGGDAWVAGFLSGLLSQPADCTVSPDNLASALRRGDLLAALSQETHGDFSAVTTAQLRAAETRWAGRVAQLPPPADAKRPRLENGGASGASGASGHAAAVVLSKPVGAGVVVGASRPQMTQAQVIEAMGRTRLVPVVALDDATDAVPVGNAMLAGGLKVVEIVFRTAAAEEALARMCRHVPGLVIGAGTVLDVAQAQRAVAAGAQFIVAPGLNATVVRWCLDNGVAVMPGVATPTEMEAAMALGLTHLKFFPAETLGGVGALKNFSAPYGSLRFMPTGGVSLKNLDSYLALPAVLCCGGTWIIDKEALKVKDYAKIEKLSADAVAAVKKATAPE